MLSNILLALVVIYLSAFCTGASFKCFSREKEITKPMSRVEIYCHLDNVLKSNEYFILEKGKTAIGQCSLHGCYSTPPYSFELSIKESTCTFQIRDLEEDDSGAYYASLRTASSVLNRVLALNLSVSQIIPQQPTCGMKWRKSSREVELSCGAMLHSYGETSLQLVMMDNGTEVRMNSSLNNTLNSSHVYGVHNVVKSVTSLNALLTRAIVPRMCVFRTSQKSNFCRYPLYTGMNIVVTEYSFIGCLEKQREVWLLNNDFKLLKLHTLKPTNVDTHMANGDRPSFTVICGMETRGLIDIQSITKFTINGSDTCYSARVEETLMQTGLNIVPGCVSTPEFDNSSYSPTILSNKPNLSLTTEATDFSTEIPATVAECNSPFTVHLTSNGPTTQPATTKQMSKKLPYLKYATFLCIVTSVTILFTITTCLFLAHQKMNTTDGKNLTLQYYRYDRQGEDLASVRRDDLATASTANLTSLLVNSLNSSQLDFSQAQSVNDSDGCNGEVSRALVHRPALPPRGHSGESNHEAYHGRRINSAEVGKANAFAMVISKYDQTENYPPARPASEPKFCSATAVPKDSESIYHTVNDMHQDLYQDAFATKLSDAATYALCPGANADLQKEHEISALGQPGKRDDRADNHSHNEEGKCTVLDPDPDIQVKELLYAKPNKKGKSTSLSASGCLEYLVEGSSCNEPTALESSEYAELRQSHKDKQEI